MNHLPHLIICLSSFCRIQPFIFLTISLLTISSTKDIVQPPPPLWRDVAGTDSIAIYLREREIAAGWCLCP